MAAGIALGAVFFAVGGSAHPGGIRAIADDVAPLQVVPATPNALSSARAGAKSVPGEVMPASRWRVVGRDVPRVLPVGLAPERGLQIKTILVSRILSAQFPEILSIGGVRPDSLRWHPNGLALDVMIPNPGSAEGIALGNEILAFAMKNADRFGVQDVIWRGTYYTPSGPHGSGYGHYDHVHITTTGGGYPSGGEVYIR